MLTSANARRYLIEILNVSEILFHKGCTCSSVFVRWCVTALGFLSNFMRRLLLIGNLLKSLYFGWVIVFLLVELLSLLKLLLLIVFDLLLLLLQKPFLLLELIHIVPTHPMFHTVWVHLLFYFRIHGLLLLALIYEFRELIGILVILILNWPSIYSLFPFLHFW